MHASLDGERVEIWHFTKADPKPSEWVKTALETGIQLQKNDVIVKHKDGKIEVLDEKTALQKLKLLTAAQAKVMSMTKMGDAKLLKVKNGFDICDAWKICPNEEPIGWVKEALDKKWVFWDEISGFSEVFLKAPGFYLGSGIGSAGDYLVMANGNFRIVPEKDFNKQYRILKEAGDA